MLAAPFGAKTSLVGDVGLRQRVPAIRGRVRVVDVVLFGMPGDHRVAGAGSYTALLDGPIVCAVQDGAAASNTGGRRRRGGSIGGRLGIGGRLIGRRLGGSIGGRLGVGRGLVGGGVRRGGTHGQDHGRRKETENGA